MATVNLDLMELDGMATPDALAAEIFRQNPEMPLPVPLEELASLAGIQSIEELTTDDFEGALLTNLEKSSGVILVKSGSNPQRRRFTIGHELGHYLLPWHKQINFQCKSDDIKSGGSLSSPSGNQNIEAEANQFASELLMPRAMFKQRLRAYGEPDLQHVVSLSSIFDASVEATVRRYETLSDFPVAFVFSREETVRYWCRSPEFPFFLRVRKGAPLPYDSSSRAQLENQSSDWEEVDADQWLSEDWGKPLPDKVLEQTLYQLDGYKVTMLYIEDIPEDDEE